MPTPRVSYDNCDCLCHLGYEILHSGSCCYPPQKLVGKIDDIKNLEPSGMIYSKEFFKSLLE